MGTNSGVKVRETNTKSGKKWMNKYLTGGLKLDLELNLEMYLL